MLFLLFLNYVLMYFFFVLIRVWSVSLDFLTVYRSPLKTIGSFSQFLNHSNTYSFPHSMFQSSYLTVLQHSFSHFFHHPVLFTSQRSRFTHIVSNKTRKLSRNLQCCLYSAIVFIRVLFLLTLECALFSTVGVKVKKISGKLKQF